MIHSNTDHIFPTILGKGLVKKLKSTNNRVLMNEQVSHVAA